jgi:hypothetical protein
MTELFFIKIININTYIHIIAKYQISYHPKFCISLKIYFVKFSFNLKFFICPLIL